MTKLCKYNIFKWLLMKQYVILHFTSSHILASTEQLLRLMNQYFLFLYNIISTSYFHQFIVHLPQSSSTVLDISKDFFTSDKGDFSFFNTKHLQFWSCGGKW